MKSQVIVSVFVGSSLMVGAEPVPPENAQVEPVPAQVMNQDAVVMAALQKLSGSLERLVAMLTSIKDKPTAELHAFDVGNLFIDYETSLAEYQTATAGMKESDVGRMAMDDLRRYKFLNKRFRVQCRRLSWANHYDCLDLRTAMGEDVADHETEPEKERPLLPDEQVQQLAASVANAHALYLSCNSNVKGGPGFSRETAWVMLDYKMSVIPQEYEIMKQVIRQTPDRQSLVYEGERWYDLLEYDVKVDGVTYTVDQWFDITLHADTMNARAKAAATSQPPVEPAVSVPAASAPAETATLVPTTLVTPAAVPPASAPAASAGTPATAPAAEATDPAPTTKKTKRSRSNADPPATTPTPEPPPAPAVKQAPAPMPLPIPSTV
ncbi:MAG: hypothetical protein IKV82_07070 [Akkermansia sp.]|nr:hypothetical protein [Akkermansia sp.]